jgi:hypothetical protein
MKCKHNWMFLERWFSSGNDGYTEYVFYCTKCLEFTNQKIEFVKFEVKL